MKKGFSILEILISVSILVVLIVFVLFSVLFTIRQIAFFENLIQANYLAQEGQEIARENQEEEQEQINGFLRTISFEDVFRDENYNISEIGTLDPETKKVVVTVIFQDQEIRLINYLTNWRYEE